MWRNLLSHRKSPDDSLFSEVFSHPFPQRNVLILGREVTVGTCRVTQKLTPDRIDLVVKMFQFHGRFASQPPVAVAVKQHFARAICDVGACGVPESAIKDQCISGSYLRRDCTFRQASTALMHSSQYQLQLLPRVRSVFAALTRSDQMFFQYVSLNVKQTPIIVKLPEFILCPSL